VTATPRHQPVFHSIAARARRRLLSAQAALALFAILIFIAFTWRSTLMFFSGDDMMNMYKAWQAPVRDLLISLAAFWRPAYRPLGGVVYRLFYGVFGFHPLPLYAFSWALLIANIALLYVVVARVTRTLFHPLLACVIASVHGMYLDLYYSAGTVYDHLSAFFVLLALVLWFSPRLRNHAALAPLSCAIVLLTIAACDSKENAVALPVLLLAGELLLVPGASRMWPRLRWLVPIALSTAIVAIFIATRVAGTADLNANPVYRPRTSALLPNLSTYLGDVTYGALSGPRSVILILIAIVAITAILRSAPMVFGSIWFVATLLPVAMIMVRSGYILYLPMMGLGLWASDLLYRLLKPIHIQNSRLPAVAVLASVLLCVWHKTHWPADPDPRYSPEFIATRTFRLRYPHLQPGAKLLFITDPFPHDAWDLYFNIKLLYHDDTLIVDRLLSGMRIQRPGAVHQVARYDHVFVYRQPALIPPYYFELASNWPMADFTPPPGR
jgi:hypothetical protein